ncbi:hypothetical protein MPL3365_130260 [Mesorhizobium plurifarium]|uniref:Uncharacterized protein n=1 Tax=Mesorhizobium plurifarium TaxID=69974 RepID=A0A090FWE6_MESPL|nr:hypothetical protein MPL3365_130260 [Mesorhizobium plurifarium]
MSFTQSRGALLGDMHMPPYNVKSVTVPPVRGIVLKQNCFKQPE